MAQLPPGAPTMAAPQDLSWTDFQPPSTTPAPPIMALDQPNPPSWIDEGFVDFSAAKRRAHRKSIRDPTLPEVSHASGEFERFDNEAQQLLIMSMLNNELKGAVDGPTSSSGLSGNGSSNAKKRTQKGKPAAMKSEHEEAESKKDEDAVADGAPALPAAESNETVVDPKRVKRILANRQSARRSRVRKLQYISELERTMTILQTEVTMLSPRVAYLDHQRMILNADNSALKSKIAALSQDKLFKEAQQEALKREIERLNQVYQQKSTAPNAENVNISPILSPPSFVVAPQAP